MAIKILRQGLPTLGYLKIGANYPKDSKQKGAPYKFDHIEITGRERDKDDNLVPDVELMRKMLAEKGVQTCGGCARSKTLGFPGGLPTKVGIFLAHDDLDLAFPNQLAWYSGRTNVCRGDGETAQRREPGPKKKVKGKMIQTWGDFAPHEPCGPTCPQFQDRKCKPNAKLKFSLVADMRIGGTLEFKTTSWGSIANIEASLQQIRQETGGMLTWIPMYFEVVEESVQPKDQTAPLKAQIARVYPAVAGGPQELRAIAAELIASRSGLLREQRRLESGMDRTKIWDEPAEEIEHIVKEFYPTSAMGGEAPAPEPDVPASVQTGEAGGSKDTSAIEPPASAPLPTNGREADSRECVGPGQIELLKAKARMRAEALGMEEEAGSTILSHVLKALQIESIEDVRVPGEINEVLQAISSYEMPGGE
jgi:hypothetical protein